MGNYIPATDSDRREMLGKIGIDSLDDLYSHIPQRLMLDRPLNIDSGLSELEVLRKVKKIAAQNKIYGNSFRGAGAYSHYIPAVVSEIVSKETFSTAYTPYQAEISQGILQSIFEYQTDICMLTGMDVSNAGVYDGAEAAAEAAAMCFTGKKNKILVSACAHPDVIGVIKTYCFGKNTECVIIPEKDYATDLDALADMLDDSVAGVYIAQPNFYGKIEDTAKAAQLAHSVKAKAIIGVNPISLALIKTPAEDGADIAVGEAQPLGLPVAFGGPYSGFMATKSENMRKLPGRIVGETTDTQGRVGYVLTLQAREQHIRREKASSNICSNEALCALAVGAYLAAMGPDGLKDAASQCTSKAHYLKARLSEIGYNIEFDGEYFHEFVTDCPIDTAKAEQVLEDADILGPLVLDGKHSGRLLWCTTEMNSKGDIDRLISILEEVGKC